MCNFQALIAANTLYNESKFSEAFAAYTPLAEEGNSVAQYCLATLYRDGKGVEKNLSTAFLWMKRSAEGENLEALFELGEMYRMGVGCRPHPYEATQCYKQAAAKGHAEAANSYGMQLEVGVGVTKSISQARDAYQQSTVLQSEKGSANLKRIESLYPFTASGRVDISQVRPSRFSYLCMGIAALINLLLALVIGMNQSAATSVAEQLPLLFPVTALGATALLLLRKPLGGYLLYATPVAAFLYLLLFRTITQGADATTLTWGYIALWGTILSCVGLYAALQIAPPTTPYWSAVMRRPFDGENELSSLYAFATLYGEGDSFREGSKATTRFSTRYNLLGGVVALAALLFAWVLIAAKAKLLLHLNWNFFTSFALFPLLMGALVVEFRFKLWGKLTALLVRKKDDTEPSLSAPTPNWKDSLVPLLLRFAVLPLALGAATYYVVLLAISLVGIFIPYLLILLYGLFTFYFFTHRNALVGRRYRQELSYAWAGGLILFFALSTLSWLSITVNSFSL